ncbi:type-F conjugative transfer system mating-pair stabilization protein TraN [Pantoea agglomerans]|uniref:type-F conjugative transfer system mating-pair stabilization protein TraN n=3 Tax=Enterobacter agglomerans TaxID=549 RepID=UPI001F4E7147|nr:type-F conjugative transfer system mating-pair stabilization protein TraN [Pantoea agglomerans]
MKQLKNFLLKRTKKHFLIAAVLGLSGMALQVSASEMDDAFNSASGLAGQNKNQGSNTLSNSNVNTTVPSATSNPPQAGYYGGVQGSSGSLNSAASSVPANNEAYQAVSQADAKNPPTKIDQNADFIQNGVNIEANSSSTFDGGSPYCTDTQVSKSVFQSYTCDRDLAVEQTCARTGSVIVTGSSHTETRSMKMLLTGARRSGNQILVDFTFPETATLLTGSTQMVYTPAPSYNSGANYVTSILNNTVNLRYGKGAADNLNVAGQQVNAGQTYTAVITPDGSRIDSTINTLIKYINNGTTLFHLDVTFNVTVSDKKADTAWTESCSFDKSQATASTGSVCSDPGGTRTITSDGQSYSQTQSCWQYQDSYIVPVNSQGSCKTLASDRNCTVAAKGCTDSQNGTCMHEQDTYQCQVTYTSKGQVCGGDYYCISGDCGNTTPNGSNEFGQLVAELAAVAAAGDDTKTTAPTVSIFTGKPVSCRKAMAGFSNCCVDSGWGNSAGFEQCNSEEKAIGEAKDKKVIIKVGTYCGKSVLGVCVQKKEGYCEFSGKLAKIIQEQGRLKQLNISFGNAESPNCRGLTVEELQRVNFDKIDYADFYSEVQGNVKLPENQETIDRIKAKINTQTSNMGGSQ